MQTALICVLIAGLMPYLWTTVAKATGPRYDNRHVREWQSKLTGAALRAHHQLAEAATALRAERRAEHHPGPVGRV